MDKLKSRKFWIAVVGALTPIISQFFSQEITLEQSLIASSAILISYIFGQAYVDAKNLEIGAGPANEDE